MCCAVSVLASLDSICFFFLFSFGLRQLLHLYKATSSATRATAYGSLQVCLTFSFRRFASLVAPCFGVETSYKAWHHRDARSTPPRPRSQCHRRYAPSPRALPPLVRAAIHCLPCRPPVRPRCIHQRLLLLGERCWGQDPQVHLLRRPATTFIR
jgi:hypothetical protein